MSTISSSPPVSSVLIAGQRAAKYCRAAVGFDDFGPRIGGIGLSFVRRLSFAPRRLTMVLVDYARLAPTSTQALWGDRYLAEALSFLAFNIVLITGAAVLCISGYGLVEGLTIVVLAVAPVLTLLSIAIYGQIE